MEKSNKYDPSQIEEKWYKYWEERKYFQSKPDDREPYTIVIPPPNVTGVLHMGHMLNVTIQDVLTRKARLEGKNACFVPGTDHASIATEAKVVRALREKGIKKSDLTREEFLTHAWDWTHKYGGIILQQLKKLGASCDWDRTAFTMDEERYNAVIKVFVSLYKRGKLYRGQRMVNWDPVAQTVLSNEEVLYKEESAKLYHVKYKIEGEANYITIATTRPETILGDTGIAVNPEDERYTHFKGKKAIVPLLGRAIPIIFDSYVDKEFGTGALKVTPAHDPNDYEIGKTHNLEVIDMMNDDGTVSEAGKLYVGEDRAKARKLILADLREAGQLVEEEDLVHNVGRSERTNAIVEPKLSLQWYVDMKRIAEPALEAVMNDTVDFFPKKYKNTYRHWMENIRDWCISRQLWWGQRIPAYYLGDEVFVAETPEEALAQAKEKTGNKALKIEDLKQDEDVLDTWFSSWLWPMSVFDGFYDRKEIEYYYPTTVLVTGWDIIFLWVARMIMAGYEWEDNFPFKDVYFTGMVRDKKRRKMSKSLGNSPDALELLAEYGADGVRYGMLSCAPAGGDLLFDLSLVDNGRKFSNKIWNAVSYVLDIKTDDSLTQPASNVLSANWINQLLDRTIEKVNKSYIDYRLSEALITLYSFVWTDVFSWYLEMVKPEYGSAMDTVTKKSVIELYEKICILLHPFMPFITEEVYHKLKDRKEGDDCIVASYPVVTADADKGILSDMALYQDIVSSIRDIKNKNQVAPKTMISISIETNDEIERCLKRDGFTALIQKMAFVDDVNVVEAGAEVEGTSFISGKTKFYAHLELDINVEEEIEKTENDLTYQQGFVSKIEKKLSNERFVSGAPEAVVAKDRKKLSDGQARIKALEERLDQLRKM